MYAANSSLDMTKFNMYIFDSICHVLLHSLFMSIPLPPADSTKMDKVINKTWKL